MKIGAQVSNSLEAASVASLKRVPWRYGGVVSQDLPCKWSIRITH